MRHFGFRCRLKSRKVVSLRSRELNKRHPCHRFGNSWHVTLTCSMKWDTAWLSICTYPIILRIQCNFQALQHGPRIATHWLRWNSDTHTHTVSTFVLLAGRSCSIAVWPCRTSEGAVNRHDRPSGWDCPNIELDLVAQTRLYTAPARSPTTPPPQNFNIAPMKSTDKTRNWCRRPPTALTEALDSRCRCNLHGSTSADFSRGQPRPAG